MRGAVASFAAPAMNGVQHFAALLESPLQLIILPALLASPQRRYQAWLGPFYADLAPAVQTLPENTLRAISLMLDELGATCLGLLMPARRSGWQEHKHGNAAEQHLMSFLSSSNSMAPEYFRTLSPQRIPALELPTELAVPGPLPSLKDARSWFQGHMKPLAHMPIPGSLVPLTTMCKTDAASLPKMDVSISLRCTCKLPYACNIPLRRSFGSSQDTVLPSLLKNTLHPEATQSVMHSSHPCHQQAVRPKSHDAVD